MFVWKKINIYDCNQLWFSGIFGTEFIFLSEAPKAPKKWIKTTNPPRNIRSNQSRLLRDELESLNIPYKYRDFCQDSYADFMECKITKPALFENNFIYQMPFSEHFAYCKTLKDRWLLCQQNRERELIDELKNAFDQPKSWYTSFLIEPAIYSAKRGCSFEICSQ